MPEEETAQIQAGILIPNSKLPSGFRHMGSLKEWPVINGNVEIVFKTRSHLWSDISWGVTLSGEGLARDIRLDLTKGQFLDVQDHFAYMQRTLHVGDIQKEIKGVKVEFVIDALNSKFTLSGENITLLPASSAPKSGSDLNVPIPSCTIPPECVPTIQEGDDRKCFIDGLLGRVEVRCRYCGDNGGLMKCFDIDGDGCPELTRIECGRPNGCQSAPSVDQPVEPGRASDWPQCKPLASGANTDLVQMGILLPNSELPSGFRDISDLPDNIIPVVNGNVEIVFKTRSYFMDDMQWGVSVYGGELANDIKLDLAKSQFLDVQDDFAYMRRTIHVGNMSKKITGVSISFSINSFDKSYTTRHENVTLMPSP